MAEFNLIPPDRILARIEEDLSAYGANGILDVGKLYSEVNLFSQRLGLAVYEMNEAVIKVQDYKAELPCNFYLLDSAWLCDTNTASFSDNLQHSYQYYVEQTCRTIEQGDCPPPNPTGVSISTCGNERVLGEVTIKEYVGGQDNIKVTWRNPVLLTLNNNKNIRNICAKDCKNIFAHSGGDINIIKQGDAYFLYSTLKEAVIYVKYYVYPIDTETKLPLVPDNAILENALYYRLVKKTLEQWFLNSDVDVTQKLQYFSQQADLTWREALSYVKTPSFNTMVRVVNRMRHRFAPYEIMNSRHF